MTLSLEPQLDFAGRRAAARQTTGGGPAASGRSAGGRRADLIFFVVRSNQVNGQKLNFCICIPGAQSSPWAGRLCRCLNLDGCRGCLILVQFGSCSAHGRRGDVDEEGNLEF